MPKPGTTVGKFRIVKRTKELFKGFPYYVAVDLPGKPDAWYLLEDGTIDHECNHDTMKRSANSGWFATLDDVNKAIARHEARAAQHV